MAMAIFKDQSARGRNQSIFSSPFTGLGQTMFFGAAWLALMAADTLPGDICVGLVFGMLHGLLDIPACSKAVQNALRF